MNGNTNGPVYDRGAYSAWRPRNKKLFERKGADVLTAVTLVILSVFAASALIWDGARLGYTLVFDSVFFVISAFLFKRDSTPGAFPLICAALTLVCSWSFAVTSNITVRFFVFIVTAVSSVVWFSALSGRKLCGGDLALVRSVFSSLTSGFKDLPQVLSCLFSKKGARSKTVSYVVIGVACAIPVLIIVIPLLLRSGAVFAYLAESISTDAETIVFKIIIGLIISVILIGLTFSLKYNKGGDIKPFGKSVNRVIVSSFMFAISAVYLIYLLTQIVYFFSAFVNILPERYEFTYAEYARHGFFELCVIAAVNLLVLLAAVVLSEKKEGKIPFAVKLPALFITLFTLILIVSAISKMVMYIGVYGMTVLRICTSVFMVWMATVFIALLVRLFSKKLDVFVTGLVSALILLSVLGVFNVNSFVAKYNYDAHVEDGKKIDLEYMALLGDEGVEYLYYLTEDPNGDTSGSAMDLLYDLLPEYYEYWSESREYVSPEGFSELEKSYTGIGQFSFSRSRAYSAFEDYFGK